jgi:PAS domain-containing protein
MLTKRKQAMERVGLSELRFRQLADSIPQLVWTANGDGAMDYLNTTLSHLLNQPK